MQRTSLALGGVASGGLQACDDDVEMPRGVFLHGVASGDPLNDRVILWTRVTTDTEVAWTLATDPELVDVVNEGVVSATSERDFTVKVDADGLAPGTTYFYAFEALGERSFVGRTRTAGPTDRARLAVVSCASYAHGYFHVYRHLAEEADLDLVVHLGDYVYEYGDGQYGAMRAYDPPHETLTLDDYRRRYRHYRSDTDVQAVHQQHPFACIWDDHEIANNAWQHGAVNHDPGEGDYEQRKAVAAQVYAEYMPIREQDGGKIWRRLQYGDLFDLVLLDARLMGRDVQVDSRAGDLANPTREILGAEQFAWLRARLGESTARWKVIGQQIPLSRLSVTEDEYTPFNLDQWDGYTGARERFIALLAETADTLVLTGDIHSHFAFEVAQDPFDPAAYDTATGAGVASVEFVTSSVTSEAAFERFGAAQEQLYLASNPHLRYVDILHRGWFVLDLTDARAQADYFVIDGVTRDAGVVSPGESWAVDAGSSRLVGGVTLSPRDAPPLAPGAPPRNLPRGPGE